MTTRSSSPSQRILDALYSRLERVIEGVGQKRYGADLRIDQADEHASTSSGILASIDGPSIDEFRIRITVHRVAEGIYEVRLKINEGPIDAFTYCPPDGSRSACGRAQLERRVVSSIIDEINHRIGAD